MMAGRKFRIAGLAVILVVGLAVTAIIIQIPVNRPAPTPAPSPRPEASNPEAPKLQPAPARNQPRGESRVDQWTRRLPCGATIEVVGISTHPPDVGTWWSPDGRPIAEAVIDPSNTRIAPGPRQMSRIIVVRVKGVPEGAENHWRIREFEGGSIGRARLGGKVVDGLGWAVAALPKQSDTCTIDFEVATGEWKTIKTLDPSAGSEGALIASNDASGNPTGMQTGTTLAVSHGITDLSVRLVAIDRTKKEYPAQVHTSGIRSYNLIVGKFDLPLDQIEEFHVQTRDYERAEIPMVALNPTEEQKIDEVSKN